MSKREINSTMAIVLSSSQTSEKRQINKMRRALLTLAQLRAGKFGKAIASILLSRGTLSESTAAIYTGLPVLNSRAVISALLSSGLLYVVGERQLQMRNRRRYVEIIFGAESVSINRAINDILSNAITLMYNLAKTLEIEQIVYYCKYDKILFLEREIEEYNYNCPICGEPLTPIIVDIDLLEKYLEEVKKRFSRLTF